MRSDSFLDLAVDLPAAGADSAEISDADAAATSVWGLSVNGSADTTASYPSTGAQGPLSQTVAPLSLRAGCDRHRLA